MKRSALQAKWKKEGQTAKRVKTYVKPKTAAQKLAQPELKAFDTSVSFNFDTTGEIPATGQLSLVQTGDDFTNRDGAVIQTKSLQLRGNASFVPGASATAATCCFLYIVLDRQANGAAPAVTDVLTSSTLSLALGNVPNQYRFKILKRIVLTFNSTAGVTTAYNTQNIHVDEYIKFYQLIEMRYKASAGAVTDLTSNNIFLIAGSDGGSDDLVSFNGTARLRFTG